MDQLPGYIHRSIVRAYIQNASLHGLREDVVDELVEPWTGDEGQTAFYRQIVDYDERYLQANEDCLAEIDIPVRIVWAAGDSWMPLHRGERLSSLIPAAQFHVVPDSSHLIHYDAPTALMDHVRDWLDTQTAA
jgi:pimeloyl-ACP methyl ester carboxylesterase